MCWQIGTTIAMLPQFFVSAFFRSVSVVQSLQWCYLLSTADMPDDGWVMIIICSKPILLRWFCLHVVALKIDFCVVVFV